MRKDTQTMDLFVFVEQPEPVLQILPVILQEQCLHKEEVKTETEWPGYPGDLRMTWSCKTCGRYRGRC